MREGVTDESLRIIVERIATAKDHELIFNESLSKPFNGPLGKQAVRLRTKANFDNSSVDLGFYFADADKGDFNKLHSIEDAIKSVNQTYLLKCIIGIPDPHFEEWLLGDENNVKRVFGLPGDQPMPHDSVQPKRRLELLCDNSDDILLTPPRARQLLASGLDITALQHHSSSFTQFMERCNTFYNSISLS